MPHEDLIGSTQNRTPAHLTVAGEDAGARRLAAAVARQSSRAVGAALQRALQHLAAGRFSESAAEAKAAIATDARSAVGWRLLGLALEGEGETAAALDAYRAAYDLDPADIDLMADLARLASALGMSGAAASFLTMALAAEPGSKRLTEQLAKALQEDRQHAQAVELLRAAIRADPGDARLWTVLGEVLLQEGQTREAAVFLDEALRLSPAAPDALYDRAIVRLELGDLSGAAADCDAALSHVEPIKRPLVLFVRAQARLAAGDLKGGWPDYEARLHPDFPGAPTFAVAAPRWSPGEPLGGRRLLVLGEQGIGDEVMFAGLVPDLLGAIGPEGALTLAVAPRLVELFRRSFPGARVIAYETRLVGGRTVVSAPGAAAVDGWASLGSLLGAFRADIAAFERRSGYLRPDAAAVDRWRAALAGRGPALKVGVSWKSLNTTGQRLKRYPPFAAWTPVLQTRGVAFVNVQYGDCAGEMEQALALGAPLWSPPDLDLLADIDGAAALSAALDLVICVGNASGNIAAAVGTPTWFILPPASWPRLGEPRMPWFPRTRAFVADRFGDWSAVMAAAGEALAAEVAGRRAD